MKLTQNLRNYVGIMGKWNWKKKPGAFCISIYLACFNLIRGFDRKEMIRVFWYSIFRLTITNYNESNVDGWQINEMMRSNIQMKWIACNHVCKACGLANLMRGQNALAKCAPSCHVVAVRRQKVHAQHIRSFAKNTGKL